MRLFGLDIRRIKTLDREEEQRLKNVITAMDDTIVSTLDMISDHDLNDREFVVKVYYSIETIHTLIILYEDNKFSSPFTNVNLLKLGENLNNRAALLQQMVFKYYTMIDQIDSRLQEMGIDDFDNIADDFFDEKINELQNVMESICRLIDKQIRLITRDLIAIKTCIQYDSLRTTSGVDIVRAFYDAKKFRPTGKVEYVFKMIHQHPLKTNKED